MHCRDALVALVVLGLSLVAAPVAPAAGAEDSDFGVDAAPDGPITLLTTTFDSASVGYAMEEFFLEGTATAYEPAAPFGADGRWRVRETTTAPFRTRLVVYRPIDASDFDGTVYVEWLNVSAGFDAGPDWVLAHNEIIRSGAAWVGVSAQEIGIHGAPVTIGGGGSGRDLESVDPVRYGSLSHPGDAYSYDIFTQAGNAIRTFDANGLLGTLDAERVIAIGESQSAFRLVTYINAVQPIADTYDGFLVHSRAASAAGLGLSVDRGIGRDPLMPPTARIRTDNTTPVLTFQTETDVEYLGSRSSRQPDSKHFRLWEVAGSAHADAYFVEGLSDTGDGAAEAALLDPTGVSRGLLACSGINRGPTFAVLSAAIHHLERWVRDGTPPPKAPRLAIDGSQHTLARDTYGIARGGIRTGPVESPLVTISGEPTGAGFCQLFGTTTPLDTATIAARFPTQATYRAAFERATDAAVEAGFLLEPEAENYRAAARALTHPVWG